MRTQKLCSSCKSAFVYRDRYQDDQWPTYPRHGTVSATDASRLRDLMTDLSSDLAKYDDQLSRLRPLVDKLQQERDTLQRQVDQYNSTLATVHRLSEDLLIEIFQLSADEGAKSFVRLAHICGRWKDIIHSIKRFWSEYDLFPERLPDDYYPRPPPLELVKRSGTTPLTIWDLPMRGATPAFFIEHCARWRRISLRDYGFFSGTVPDTSPLFNNLPLLEELQISESFINDMDHWQSNTFAKAPKLHTFRTGGVQGDVRHLQIPWSQLRNLTLYSLSSPQQYHAALNLSPALQSAHFSINYCWPEAANYTSHITELTLNFFGSRSELFDPMLDPMILPSLEHLRLQSTQSHIPSGQSILDLLVLH